MIPGQDKSNFIFSENYNFIKKSTNRDFVIKMSIRTIYIGANKYDYRKKKRAKTFKCVFLKVHKEYRLLRIQVLIMEIS